jgi:cysteine desulfurase/selenocysteine lyase
MNPTHPSWEKIRADFPILDQQVNGVPLVYFDNAATSQKPRVVIDALRHYYEHDNSNVHRGMHELSARATAAYEEARAKVARYLHAASEQEIIFTRGATEGINLVAQTWGAKFVREGDVILATEMEHHSNLVPWQLLAERTGATLRVLPINDRHELALDRLDEFLTPQVKLFAFNQISNSLGTINPVAELCAAARKVGAVTLVDAAQSAGHLPIDVQALGCDFLVLSGHKMCGPTGIGALYGKLSVLETMPPWQGGGEMIETVHYEKSTWKQPPYRFEAGTPDISGAIGLGVAIDYIEAIGRENIFRHDAELTQYAYEQLAAIPGLRVLGPPLGTPRGAVLSFVLGDAHAHDVVTMANEHGVALRGGHHCTQPLMRKLGLTSSARASFYFYNTKAEVDRMVAILTPSASAEASPAFSLPLGEIYEMVVTDHARHPRNFGELAGESVVHVHGDNPSCGDTLDLHVQFGPEKVENVKFTGSGCTVCMTSASLMTLKLKGKPRAEAERLMHLFHDQVSAPADAEVGKGPRELGDLNVLRGVRKFPQRVKCAMLAWRAFEQALQENGSREAAVSTEESPREN